MVSTLPSATVLGLAALAALVLTARRRSPTERTVERRAAARVLTLTATLQAVHFLEEASTGFTDRLGSLLGLPSMPFSLFVTFNVAWLAIWFMAIPALRAGHRPAFFVAWFLAVAEVFNGVAHPGLALASGTYFPGLWSSPVVAALGIWLFWKLRRATTTAG
ncbi:MAG: HXXEE domain-containing protein [Gemmatimonadota bacterium]|nr:HXXEE domain-containing protein [Gemmatimonadota bacterium]